MNARTLLIPRTLLILSLVVLSGAPCASAQSFKERLKNACKEDRTESQTGSSAQKTSGKVR